MNEEMKVELNNLEVIKLNENLSQFYRAVNFLVVEMKEFNKNFGEYKKTSSHIDDELKSLNKNLIEVKKVWQTQH